MSIQVTRRSQLNRRTGPPQDVMGDGAPRNASVLRLGGELFPPSWQPTQDADSPGMAVNQLRINWSALPSASSGWSAIGVLAGTVPSTRRTSHGPSMPM